MVRVNPGDPLTSAVVVVNGSSRQGRQGQPPDRADRILRGLPAGRVKVKITATTRSGRQVTATRTYHTCAKRKRHR